MIKYRDFETAYINRVKEIYKEEKWSAYLNDDEKLIRAFNNSLCLMGAFDEEKLVGFIRCVGDGEHILLVQDLIIARDYQKQGIGSQLFKLIWEKYNQVRQFIVITDLTDEVDNHFYQSFGMKPLKEGDMISYFR